MPAEFASPEQQSLQRSVITMINFFEEIELSMRANRVDEGILQSAFGMTYPDIHSRFEPWIRLHTDTVQRDLLLALAKRWR